MIPTAGDFESRLTALLEREGTVLTQEAVSRIAERYQQCPGQEQWDVRAYARTQEPGGREYRVMRGSRVQDVYSTVESSSATAVRTALNELESREPVHQPPPEG